MVAFVNFVAVLAGFVLWGMIWRATARKLAERPWYSRHLRGVLFGSFGWCAVIAALIALNWKGIQEQVQRDATIAMAENAKALKAADEAAAARARQAPPTISAVRKNAPIAAAVAPVQPAHTEPVAVPAAVPTPPPAAPRSAVGSTEAWVISKNFVTDALRSPRSADFGSVFEQSPNCAAVGEAWACSGWVDAQNGFGAMIRNRFAITIKFRDGDWADPRSWDVLAGPVIASR